MDAWILWLVAACALGLGELRRGGLYLVPWAAGAALAAVMSLLGVAFLLCAIVFVIASGIALVTLAPVARRQRRLRAAIREGSAALVGREAIVLERIANYEGVGCVKIGGEVWTARSFADDEVFHAGDHVEIVEVRGATALVTR